VPEASTEGGGAYRVSIPVHSPADRGSAVEQFRTRLWYAARRAGLTLSGVAPTDADSAGELADALRGAASVLNLDAARAEALGASASLERYAAGETIHARGVVPDALRIIVDGRVVVRAAPASDTGELALFDLGRHDAIGLTAIMQRAMDASTAALTDVTILVIPAAVAARLVHDDPELAREFGEELEHRMQRTRTAFAAAGFEPPVALRVTG
jgi:CRP-like cAMP-binding protein